MLGAGAARADELAGAGWTRRFIAAPPRLDEMVALYRSLGLEVRQEAVAAEAFDADCGDCLANGAGARIIFTREPT